MIDGVTTAVRIVVLPGDGIGPEVTEAARRVLDAAATRVGLQLDFVEELVGGASVDAFGVELRPQTLRRCKPRAAIRSAAAAGRKWDKAPPQSTLRPGPGRRAFRKGSDLLRTLRPFRSDPPRLPR